MVTFQGHFLAESLVMCIFNHLPLHCPPSTHPTHPSSAHSEISAHQNKTAQNAKDQEFEGFL